MTPISSRSLSSSKNSKTLPNSQSDLDSIELRNLNLDSELDHLSDLKEANLHVDRFYERPEFARFLKQKRLFKGGLQKLMEDIEPEIISVEQMR